MKKLFRLLMFPVLCYRQTALDYIISVITKIQIKHYEWAIHDLTKAIELNSNNPLLNIYVECYYLREIVKAGFIIQKTHSQRSDSKKVRENYLDYNFSHLFKNDPSQCIGFRSTVPMLLYCLWNFLTSLAFII